jgi:hypothetical protein
MLLCLFTPIHIAGKDKTTADLSVTDYRSITHFLFYQISTIVYQDFISESKIAELYLVIE